MPLEEYLTIDELAARLKLKPKTIKNKMVNGTFIKGIHYFSPAGMGPRFKWSAVVAWLEAGEQEQAKAADNGNGNGVSKPDGHWLGTDYP